MQQKLEDVIGLLREDMLLQDELPRVDITAVRVQRLEIKRLKQDVHNLQHLLKGAIIHSLPAAAAAAAGLMAILLYVDSPVGRRCMQSLGVLPLQSTMHI